MPRMARKLSFRDELNGGPAMTRRCVAGRFCHLKWWPFTAVQTRYPREATARLRSVARACFYAENAGLFVLDDVEMAENTGVFALNKG